MRLHPTSCPFPRQAFDELLNSVNEYGKHDRSTAIGLSGSHTDRPSSHLKLQDVRNHPNPSNGSIDPTQDRNAGELLSQRSLKVAKSLYNKGHRFSIGNDDSIQQTKNPWDGAVYNEVSRNGSTSGANRITVAFAMDGCGQSIARLQRELEESGKRTKPFLKSCVQENGRDGEAAKERNLQPVQPLRASNFPLLRDTTESKGKIANSTLYPSGGLQPSEVKDSGDISTLIMKLSMARNFLDYLKVIHAEFISVCGCERVQLHFVNPVLNFTKLDNDDFQRPFQLWSANFPDPEIPCSYSQQAARQCITIRINEEAGKGSILYIPIPIPGSETARWKIFGVAELCRSTQNFWTQADEGKVKFIVDLISSMCIQRYKALRTEHEKRQAVLMQDATKALHTQDQPDLLCYKAANYACRLTNAQAARVLLASDDGKSATVYTLHTPQKSGSRPPADGEEKSSVIQGELSAVYTTVIRTGKSLAVADTRRDPRFSSTLRAGGESSAPPHLTLSRPVSGTAADAPAAHAKPPRPNTAPFVASNPLTSLRHGRSSRAVLEAAEPRNALQPQPPATPVSVNGADSGARTARNRAGPHAGGGRLSRHAGLVYSEEDRLKSASASAADDGDPDDRDAKESDEPRAGSCDPASARKVADNVILMPIVDDDATAETEPDGGDEASPSRRPVRGVLEVVNKRTGPFDETDRATLAALCGTLYRCLVHAGRAQVLQETLACDCRLLAGSSSSVQQVVIAALDKAKISTRSELAAFYTAVEGRRVLQSEGVTPRHEVCARAGPLPKNKSALAK